MLFVPILHLEISQGVWEVDLGANLYTRALQLLGPDPEHLREEENCPVRGRDWPGIPKQSGSPATLHKSEEASHPAFDANPLS